MPSSDALVAAFRNGLAELADPTAAPQMQSYMKSAMPFRGVKTPARTTMVRRILDASPPADRPTWEATVRTLWDGAGHREELYVALDVCGHRSARAWQDAHTVALYDHLVVTGGWWDVVDPVATRLLGPVLRTDRSAVEPAVRRWAVDEDMWRRRTAILVQNGARAATNVELLADVIDESIDDHRFFLRKAIGWALREYAKTDPTWVRAFVAERADRLSERSRREATRHLR